MAKNIKSIAAGLGAKIVGQVPDTGGGAFGAARLAKCVENLQGRLVPGQGKRAGRPSDSSWVRHPKIPMSENTQRRLQRLAERASASDRKVSPMQIAAQITGLYGIPGRPDVRSIDPASHPLHGLSSGLPVITGFLPDCRLSLPDFSAFSRNRVRGFAKGPERSIISISDRIYAAF